MSGRRFAVDERARVPFALVGVVLLVASATFVVAVRPDRPPSDPAVDVVMGQATAEMRTALRDAVRTASANAARNPVLTRANTSVGRVLSASTPFRDMLRVRIYLRARERLRHVTVRREDVTATVSLPPTPNVTALRRAKERVHIDRIGANDATLRVRIENVTVRARRGNGTAGRQELVPNLTVRTPVLALHDRVSRFQDRLNRGIGRPGLLQGFTARLYALTWTRGAMFYGGAPIENVLGKRHVELATNSALLAEQRAVFGRSDAAGRRAQRRATAAVALTDVFAPQSPDDEWVSRLIHSEPPGQSLPSRIASLTGGVSAPGPRDEMTVGVNRTADRAFANLADQRNLSAVFEEVYSANVSLLTERARIGGGAYPDWPGRPDRPGDWALDEEFTTFGYRVRNLSDATPSPPRGAHVFTSYARHVTQNITRVRVWESGNETARTRARSRLEYRVGVSVIGYHAPTGYAPRRGITTVHERGGPIDGPNLASIPERAVARLVDERGGPDELAKRAANGSVDTSNVTLRGTLPNGTDLRWWVLRDLTQFRTRLRNVTTRVERGRLASFQAMPAGDLANTLANNRSRLIDAPDIYGSVAEKARIAARGALFEAVRERLLDRRAERRERKNNLGSVFSRIGGGSLSMLRNGLGNVTGGQSGSTAGRGTGANATGSVQITSIDGSPPYLTTAQVGHRYVPSLARGEQIHPLATRNVNVFTNPFGDVVDALLGGILGRKVPLEAAASTLHSANTVNANRTLSTDHARLREAVAESVSYVSERAEQTLRSRGVGTNEAQREAIVTQGLAQWNSTATRALALTNGSAGPAIAAAAAARAGVNASAEPVLGAALQLTIATRVDDGNARISQGVVNRTLPVVRERLRHQAEQVAADAIGRGADRVMRRINRSFNRVETGLPVTLTGVWWATINLWYVESRGAYERFAVRARRGQPDQPGRSLRYVRDGESVSIDFDDDGTAERFGTADRIAFTVRTVVPMAVPPGMPGVGDVNGNMDERSVGWADWVVPGADPVPPSWETDST